MFDRVETDGIFWDKLWRIVDGCSPVSAACANCWEARYAARMALNDDTKQRYSGLTNGNHFNGKVRLFEPSLNLKDPKAWFVMTDVFHENLPEVDRDKLRDFMLENDNHIFLVLTKRSEEMKNYSIKRGPFPKHIRCGVTIENDKYMKRASDLIETSAMFKWVGYIPALGPISLSPYLSEIDWIVAVNEGGPNARSVDVDWLRKIRDECLSTNTPFFCKMWPEGKVWWKNGAGHEKKIGHLLDGVQHNNCVYINRS